MENSKKQKKPLKPINDNKFNLVLGLFLLMLAFVLIMDVGYTARTINFLFYFCFGFGTYVALAFLLFRGILFLLANKKITIPHKKWIISGGIIALLGISSIISLACNGSLYNVVDYNSVYFSLFGKFYENTRLPFLFQPSGIKVGGGYFGYFISACLNSIFNQMSVTYIISSIVIIIGILVGATPFIIRAAKTNIKKSKQEKNFVKKQFEEDAANMNAEDFYIIKDQTKSIIKNASMSHIEDNDFDIPVSPSKSSLERITRANDAPIVNANDAQEKTKQTTDIFNDYGYSKMGGLVKAHFVKDGVSFESHEISNNDSAAFEKPTTINIVSSSELNNNSLQINQNSTISSNKSTDLMAKKEEKRMEQMTFDFDDTDKIANNQKQSNDLSNEKPSNLVTVRPEFSDPVVKSDDIVNQGQFPRANELNQQQINNSQPSAKESPKKIKHKFIPPDLALLNDYENSAANEINKQTAEQRMDMINNIFNTFSVNARCCSYVIGPSVTRYNIEYMDTAMFKTVNNLTNDISIRLGGVDARFESIVPGETYSGLEIPNAKITTVGFKDILEKLPPRDKHPLAVAFGKNISGDVVWADLDKMPHMLVAGTTGSGKSIFIHSIVMTLIMRNNPDDFRMVLVDPKRVEMAKYKGMPHLLCPNITEPEEAVVCLNKLVDEMERRYGILEEYNVSDIGQYNELCDEKPELDKMPYYLAILDEYSDLFDRAKEIQRPIVSLAQKARACGIHLIICTQRPSTNVITGLIKGNLPTHVALMTASSVDSITIIGEGGAEKLLGKGDMLVQSAVVSKVGCVRLQGCFVQNKEILKVVDFLKSTMTTDYHPDFLDLKDHSKDPAPTPFAGFDPNNPEQSISVDDRYDEVKSIVMSQQYSSISKIQREFGFGFTRAGRIFNQLVKEGIVERPVEGHNNSRGCKVLIHDDAYSIEADIGSDEVTSSETLNEYVKNSNNTDGGY